MTEKASVEEAELLARLRAGQKAAFEELVRQYHGAMKRTATAILGEAEAEEAVQEAWVSALRHLPRFQGRSTIKTWLFTIVINEARGRLRKTKREFSMEDHAGGENVFGSERFQENGHWAREPTRWHHHSPEALLSHEDFRRCLEMTLQTLPELQRSVLTLWELRGLEAGDICNILSISASNLRVLLHRARSRVYAMVEHYEETGTC